MSDLVNVKGLADLQKFLDELPVKMEKNIMRGALRAGMKEIAPLAAANVHSVSGKLAAGLKIGTSAKGGTVMAKLRTKGPHGYLARFVEFGTAAHYIPAKKGSALSFGGLLVKSVSHPGAKPHPFMRPALDQQAQAAVVASAEYIKTRLTKQGLDTSDVMIEGDV